MSLKRWCWLSVQMLGSCGAYIGTVIISSVYGELWKPGMEARSYHEFLDWGRPWWECYLGMIPHHRELLLNLLILLAIICIISLWAQVQSDQSPDLCKLNLSWRPRLPFPSGPQINLPPSPGPFLESSIDRLLFIICTVVFFGSIPSCLKQA